jgi:hypothetical protein
MTDPAKMLVYAMACLLGAGLLAVCATVCYIAYEGLRFIIAIFQSGTTGPF